MKAIYASKMYKSSKNKDKINAAIANPINAELVTQLREYLDDEYLTPDHFPDANKPVVNEPAVNDSNIANDDDDSGSTNVPPARKPHPARLSNPTSNDEGSANDGSANDDTVDDLTDDGQIDDSASATNTDDEGIQTNTNVHGKQTIASQTVLNPKDDSSQDVLDLGQLSERIKGTLNLRQDTSEVNRVSVKDNELWIYYNDRVNLNNVMSNVIDLLQASNYYYLEFNRLARTDNAMVFEISLADTGDTTDVKED